MPPGMVLIETLRGSNYRRFEQIFIIPKGFEPSKFNCNSLLTVLDRCFRCGDLCWLLVVQCFTFWCFPFNNCVRWLYIRLGLCSRVLAFFGNSIANSASRLFILLLFYCICLSFPLVFGVWCGPDCICSWVILFTLSFIYLFYLFYENNINFSHVYIWFFFQKG